MEKINLPNCDIHFLSSVDYGVSLEDILKELISATPWEQRKVVVYGNEYNQPRLVSWHGDAPYTYSGLTLTPNPWTDLLNIIRNKVEEITGTTFNSALLNYYRDNNDSIGMHSDNEKELGNNPTIASVSFGEKRTMMFKSKTGNKSHTYRLSLLDGSLLLMGGNTQSNWTHGIPKEKTVCGPRINITFRNIIS